MAPMLLRRQGFTEVRAESDSMALLGFDSDVAGVLILGTAGFIQECVTG